MKEQIDLCGELALEGTMARTVVHRQQNECILILNDTTKGTVAEGRVECHNVHILCFMIL
jgi:hypothetical protein